MYHNVRFMKKERSKKRIKIPVKETAAKSDSAVASKTPEEVMNVQPTTSVSMPPPDWLFQQAEQEPDFQTLSAYVDSIQLLRDKGFSYREIAQWLSEHGVLADHNAVYRVYHNNLSDYDSYLEDQRENQEALDEAERNQH
jgi:hypothetical protein